MKRSSGVRGNIYGFNMGEGSWCFSAFAFDGGMGVIYGVFFMIVEMFFLDVYDC